MDARYSSHSVFKLVQMPRWAFALGLIVAVALGLLLIVLAAGLALIIIPVATVAGMILRWRVRRHMAEAARQEGVIDAEYRIIDRNRLP